jgi:hypothetical protein
MHSRGLNCPSPAQGCRSALPSGSIRRATAQRDRWKWARWTTLLVAALVCGLALTEVASAGPTSRASASAYFEAAVRGDPAAQAKLAEMYAKTSQKEAFQWCWRAAQQGHAGAQLQLAEMFANGQGVPKHLVTAYVWAHLAQSNAVGDEMTAKADQMIVRLADQMSVNDIREALHRADDWKPQPEARPPERTETKNGSGFSLATDSSQGERRTGRR